MSVMYNHALTETCIAFVTKRGLHVSNSAQADEWAERVRLRTAEIASINEAISVLRSDDARDTFKKSFDSQSPALAR